MSTHVLRFTVIGQRWDDIENAVREVVTVYTGYLRRPRGAGKAYIDGVMEDARLDCTLLPDGRWSAAVEVHA